MKLLYKNKYWQGIPILPDLDIKSIKRVLHSSNYNNIYDKKNNKECNILEF